MKPTVEQKEAIETLDKNLVVAAGAGSGKTMVLSARFKHIVEEGKANVDEILTLTFTEKAAAEMKTRIRTSLAESEIQAVQEQMHDFGKAEISTIDSFCRRVVGNANLDLGIPSEFSADLKKLDQIIRDEVYAFLNQEDNRFIQELISSFGLETVWDELSTFASKYMLVPNEINFLEEFQKSIKYLEDKVEDLLAFMSFNASVILEESLTVEDLDQSFARISKAQRAKFPSSEEVLEALKNANTAFFEILQMNHAEGPYKGFLNFAIPYTTIKQYIDSTGIADFQAMKTLFKKDGLGEIIEKLNTVVNTAFRNYAGKTPFARRRKKVTDCYKNLRFLAGDLTNKDDVTDYQGVLRDEPENVNLGDKLEYFIALLKDYDDEIVGLSALHYYFEQKDAIAEYCKDLQKLAEKIIEIKKSSGLLSFDDVAVSAVYLLRTNKELREYYKSKYKFIMIDEFQDNNKLQKDLLYLLAEKEDEHSEGVPTVEQIKEDKLFFVGDQKQSIYRFRDADVSVFKSLSNELASAGGKEFVLPNNFRSEPELIEFFNFLFSEIMEKADADEDKKVDYEAEYAKLGAREANISSDIKKITLAIQQSTAKKKEGVDDESDDEDVDSTYGEAYYIAQKIKEIVTSKDYYLAGWDKELRPAKYSDIVVLMRATTDQYILEKIFDQADIPYSTDATTSLFYSDLTSDFLAVLESVILFEAKTAFYSVVRSPFVNIEDDNFYSFIKKYANLKELLLKGLCKKDFEEDDFTNNQILAHLGMTFEEFQNWKNEFLEKGINEDFVDIEKKVFEFFKDVILTIYKGSISGFFNYLWNDKGYRYLYLSGQKEESYKQIFEVLYRLAQNYDQEGKGFDEFLDYVLPLLNNYEKIDDLNLPNYDANSVRIMTIHKSKGLEFPICFVTLTGKTPKPSNPPSISYLGNHLAIKVKDEKNINPINNVFKVIEEKMEAAELKRLLYVALTRAESFLFVTGSFGKSKNPQSKSLLRLFHDEGLTYKDGKDDVIPLRPGIGEHAELDEIKQLSIKEAIINARKLAFSKKEKQEIDFYKKENLIKEEFPKKTFSVTALNDAFYKINKAELCMDLNDFRKNTYITEDFDKFLTEHNLNKIFGTIVHSVIENKLLEKEEEADQGLLSKVPAKYVSKVEKAALNTAESFFASDIYQEIINHADNIKSEAAFLLKLFASNACLFVNGVIDLYYEINNEIKVIDFKTDVVPRNKYSVQLNIYKRALEKLTGKKVKTYLFFLRSGSLVEVKEEIQLGELDKIL